MTQLEPAQLLLGTDRQKIAARCGQPQYDESRRMATCYFRVIYFNRLYEK